jgi:hypothetical protein
VAGDEVYGSDPHLRAALEHQQLGYVLAVARDHQITTRAGKIRADTLVKRLPKRAWQKLSAGLGTTHHGHGLTRKKVFDKQLPNSEPKLRAVFGKLAAKSPQLGVHGRQQPPGRARPQGERGERQGHGHRAAVTTADRPRTSSEARANSSSASRLHPVNCRCWSSADGRRPGRGRRAVRPGCLVTPLENARHRRS